jgi:hypothetical protein
MLNALLYLTGTTLRNSLVERVRRLRQPKYLLAAIAGTAYFYFFVFRLGVGNRNARAAFGAGLLPAGTDHFVPFAAAALFLLVLLGWIFGRERAAMNFTEAETAFLFPAPVARRTLLHYKLLRAQLPILFSAFVLSFIFRRGAALGGSTLLHATGWWLILSTLNLHFLASSFTRQRLLELGLTRWRRMGAIAVVLALAGGTWVMGVRASGAAPALAEGNALGDYVAWGERLLALPPLGWVLTPFGWLVRPYLTAGWPDFLAVAGPAVLLLAVHYLWVIGSAVAFEEASLELSARRARTLADIRQGGVRAVRLPKRKRPAPFPLGATGWAPVAFLWKSLTALGPVYRVRVWLILAAALVGGTSWLRAIPGYAPYLKAVGVASFGIGAYLLVLGPLFMRRNAAVILTQLEMTKSYPLPGWQIVTGELLTPAVVVTFVEWLFLLAVCLTSGSIGSHSPLAVLLAGGVGGAFAIALLVPPLIALMMCIPLATMLYFPAWTKPAAAGTGGVEAVGQGIIMMVGYIVVLLITLLPAAAVGAAGFLITNWLAGRAAAFVVTLLLASALLVFELAAAVWWLGGKLERFDLSREMPH